MQQTTSAILAGWANFYVIVGSSAGGLTGLQFVVMTLISESETGGGMREVRAFGTPTVVHFCAALFISAAMSAPWHALWEVSICLGTCGLAGLAFGIETIWHTRKSSYVPDTEDWIWYVILPLVAYAALTVAAILLIWQPSPYLFLIAASTLLFLLSGIHNAWDTVTYIAVQRAAKKTRGEEANPPKG